MQPVICKYFPCKKKRSGFLDEPLPITAFVGAKPKWVVGDSLFSDDFTIIGKDENGLFCSMFTWDFGEGFLSTADLEKEILERKKRKEIALKSEGKRAVERALVDVAVIGAYAAKEIITGNHVHPSGKSVEKNANTIKENLGLRSPDVDFDEVEFRKNYLPIEGTNMWARIHPFADFYRGQPKADTAIFCGIPANYSGDVNHRCCITYQMRKNDYKIVEYPDERTMQKGWTALKRYGFFKTLQVR